MFNVWTFLFEVVNFLVLLWVLKRVLYRPIMRAIEERQGRLRRQTEDLEVQRRQLEDDRRRQEEALRGIDAERGRVLAEAHEEAERERKKVLEEARADAQQLHERERAALAEERRRALREVEERVLQAAVEVSEGLLNGVAGLSLHDELVGLARRELAALPGDEAARLLQTMPAPALRIVSARPLSPEQRRLFDEAARGMGGVELDCSEDAGLSAGARVELGELVLDATLASQLAQVRRLARERLEGKPAAPREAGG